MNYFLNAISSPILIIPYQDSWVDDFTKIAQQLRSLLGNMALRIDHIGSTSVPGLASKDIIDVQITISNLENCDDLSRNMVAIGGYHQRENVREDHIPIGEDPEPKEWRKLYFREADNSRRTHIHVREIGRQNQIYALLFRDYLRNNIGSVRLYEQLKYRLAEMFPHKIDSYLYIKDPLCDLIMQSARKWKEEINWSPGASDG